MRLHIFFVLFLLITGFTQENVYAASNFSASFDRSITFDEPRDFVIEKKGGRIVEGGILGRALSLSEREYISFDASKVINPTEGSIIFWMRPHWSNNDTSHTFFSFSWNDERKSYFVFSHGWWESGGGKDYTYFVFNNQEGGSIAKKILYTKDKWIHFACTWRSGDSGFVKLYVNGLLAGGNYKKIKLYHPFGKLYVGTDEGTPLKKERWGNSDIDELAFFDRALLDEEILHLYNAQTPGKYIPVKNSKGQILQTRAIFDEGTGWTTKNGADQTIKRIKKAGFNVYVPCIWHGMGTRYPSMRAPAERNQIFTYDPLEYVIELAHKNGIEVHPWFCVSLRQREFLKQFYEPGVPEDMFNIHRPQFREFITHLVLDVVAKYNVDGTNLDFIRTGGFCISEYCKSQFKEIYKRDLLTELNNKGKDGRLSPEVQEWIDNAVEAVVSDISVKGKRIKPNLIMSVDGYPIPSDSIPSPQGRHEVRWANKGYIDVIYNMEYGRAPDFERLEKVKKDLIVPERLLPLLGNYDRGPGNQIKPRSATFLVELLNYSQRLMPQGANIYIYSQLSDEQVDLLSIFFRDDAVPLWRQ